jgi:hypothetical protein
VFVVGVARKYPDALTRKSELVDPVPKLGWETKDRRTSWFLCVLAYC